MGSKSPQAEEYFDELCQRVLAETCGHTIRLIGFSIGASVALRVGALLGSKVEAIYLISPAAPLEKGNTKGMGVGRYTFLLAKRHPRLFNLFGSYQASLTKINPLILLRLLFSGARGMDADLLAVPETREWLETTQKMGFSKGADVYNRDVKLYVGSWSHILKDVTAPVSIWYGDEDNWAPMVMSEYLRNKLQRVVVFKQCAGQSHYSCLIENSHDVMKAVAKAPR